MLNFSLGMRNICPTKSSANLFNWLAIFEPSAIKLVFSIRNGSSGNLSRFLDRQSWMDLWSSNILSSSKLYSGSYATISRTSLGWTRSTSSICFRNLSTASGGILHRNGIAERDPTIRICPSTPFLTSEVMASAGKCPNSSLPHTMRKRMVGLAIMFVMSFLQPHVLCLHSSFNRHLQVRQVHDPSSDNQNGNWTMLVPIT